MPEASRPLRMPFEHMEEEEKYLDRSFDHVARVRAARESAQREMESFGDVSEYDITIIQGRLREESSAGSQPSLDFQGDAAPDSQEGD